MSKKTFHLNGNKPWLLMAGWIFLNFGGTMCGGIWWASNLNTRMNAIESQVAEVKKDLTEDIKEVQTKVDRLYMDKGLLRRMFR